MQWEEDKERKLYVLENKLKLFDKVFCLSSIKSRVYQKFNRIIYENFAKVENFYFFYLNYFICIVRLNKLSLQSIWMKNAVQQNLGPALQTPCKFELLIQNKLIKKFITKKCLYYFFVIC